MAKQAWVLMTALPPTKGHRSLIEFATNLDVQWVNVLLNTQPDEPFIEERVLAVEQSVQMTNLRVNVKSYDDFIQQVPDGEDDTEFWSLWAGILERFGCQPRDYIVASEHYGKKLAEVSDCTFIPYDIERTILPTRAENVRTNLLRHFSDILPEFQEYLQKRITFFGAESTGKTTTSQYFSDERHFWIPEWARLYLEEVGPEVTTEKLTNIWHGQAALQRTAPSLAVDYPFIVQDTDLFSTVGYWQLGGAEAPDGLIDEALELKSDLYIILSSDIPFEKDPLRYGGDRRETEDQYWTDLCFEHGLDYVVLTDSFFSKRVTLAEKFMNTCFDLKSLEYERVR